MSAVTLGVSIREGQITRTVYSLIQEKKYDDVIEILLNFNETSTSRAGLSLLGYCYYITQKYIEAANCYELLCNLMPNNQNYKLYYVQSLYQAGISEESLNALKQIDSAATEAAAGAAAGAAATATTTTTELMNEQILQLQNAIEYSMENYSSAQATLNQRQSDHPETMNDEGCLLYQAERYDRALEYFKNSIQLGGYNPLVAYNIALCHYKRRENAQALNYIAEIIERGIRNHPELGIGIQIDAEGGARSVGNPISLALSGLTQAFNLKAAIEYQEGNIIRAREALLDLPPRSESELDPVTLHNMALTDPNGPGAGLKRLAFLLDIGPPTCPQETFSNILLLCCKHEMYDTAADILAEHAQLTYRYLTPYLYELLDALITAQASTEDAHAKLGNLEANLAGKLRTVAAKVQETRSANDQNSLRNALKEYEIALENYLSVVMARAWLAWRDDDYIGAEREFRSSAEFCSENSVWRLHAAHVLFMQGDKYREASAFYEPIVRQHYDDIMSVSAAVLANLCVSYIMTFQNEEAEELMRKVEKAEEQKSIEGEQSLHLCIINLVVGTLYCAKSNYEFGLSRIAHALEGGSGIRLCADTWLHVKRCILGLLTGMAKQNVTLATPALQEVLSFLHSCEVFGIQKPSKLITLADDIQDEPLTIGMEARKLRVLLMRLTDYE